MNVSVLMAGWPFAVLLMMYARCADRARLSGIVIGKDDRSGVLVLERDGIAYPLQIDVTTMILGVDGYPVPLHAIRVGDHAEVLQ
jgi:hypothetical protein